MPMKRQSCPIASTNCGSFPVAHKPSIATIATALEDERVSRYRYEASLSMSVKEKMLWPAFL